MSILDYYIIYGEENGTKIARIILLDYPVRNVVNFCVRYRGESPD
jgi:hypothetical protein